MLARHFYDTDGDRRVGAAWRKEALQAAGRYSHDTLAEDADLTMTLQKLGYKVAQENRAVV